jgi:hypothetical protein
MTGKEVNTENMDSQQFTSLLAALPFSHVLDTFEKFLVTINRENYKKEKSWKGKVLRALHMKYKIPKPVVFVDEMQGLKGIELCFWKTYIGLRISTN